jgi:hypothetical protein
MFKQLQRVFYGKPKEARSPSQKIKRIMMYCFLGFLVAESYTVVFP